MSSTPSGAAGAEELQSITVPKIGEVPFELFNRHEKRTTRLINSSGSPEPVKSQSRLFYFEFNEFICVTWIVIETLEFSDGMEFDYKWQGPDYVEHSGTQRVKGDRVEIRIDGIVKSISFKPPRHFFAKPYINRVKIFGFPLKEAESFIRFAEKLEDLRERENKHFAAQLSNLEEKKIEVAAIQASRGTLQQDIEKLKSQFSREQGRLRKIEAEIAISTTKLAEMERNSSTQSDLFCAPNLN